MKLTVGGPLIIMIMINGKGVMYLKVGAGK